MKYWVFQNNQVSGPFEPEDLSQLAGFSGDSLICPEGRKGTNMGDWQRASLVAELTTSLAKASQMALTIKGSGGFAALPPEPTLKDLAALGSLQEKVSLLDNTVAHLQESLRLKDDELLSLHKEVEEKSRSAQELAAKIGGLEEHLSQLSSLKDGLDKAVAAEHDVEATVKRQSETIAQLTQQLNSLKSEHHQIEDFKNDLARVKEDQLKSSQAVRFEPAAASSISLEPQPVVAAPASFESKPVFSASPMPFDAPASLSPSPRLGSVETASSSVIPEAPPERKKAGAKVALMMLGAVATLSFGAYYMGLIPKSLIGGGAPETSSPESATTPIATMTTPSIPESQAPELAPVEPTPPAPDPAQQLEEQKKLAIEIAREWMLADGSMLGAKLEQSIPEEIKPAPWAAEPSGENAFEVRFMAPRIGKRKAATFRFTVLLPDKHVSPANAPATAVFAAKVAKKLRPRLRPSLAADLTDDVLPVAPRPKIRPKANRRTPKKTASVAAAAPAEEFGDMPLPGMAGSGNEENSAPAGEPASQELLSVPSKPLPRPNKPKIQPAADAELLDDLLKP